MKTDEENYTDGFKAGSRDVLKTVMGKTEPLIEKQRGYLADMSGEGADRIHTASMYMQGLQTVFAMLAELKLKLDEEENEE